MSSSPASAKATASAILAAMHWPGGVDVAYECSGAESCVQTAIHAVRAGGSVVLMGMGLPAMTLPVAAAAVREVDILGSFRYAYAYPRAIELLKRGFLPEIELLVTHRFVGLQSVADTFAVAAGTRDPGGGLVVKVEVRL